MKLFLSQDGIPDIVALIAVLLVSLGVIEGVRW
jgi:hypothetical protein